MAPLLECSVVRLVSLAVGLVTSMACGGQVMESAGGEPAEESMDVPLKVGARWDYEVEDSDGLIGTLIRTIDRCEVVSWTDCETGEPRSVRAYVQLAIDERSGKQEERYLVRQDGRLVRVLEQRLDIYQRDTYSPAFDRVFFGEYESGRSEFHRHTLCRERPNLPMVTSQRAYRFIMMPETSVEVPAGSFRVFGVKRNSVSGTMEYWYSPGIGKVLERGPHGTERLVRFSPGTDTCE